MPYHEGQVTRGQDWQRNCPVSGDEFDVHSFYIQIDNKGKKLPLRAYRHTIEGSDGNPYQEIFVPIPNGQSFDTIAHAAQAALKLPEPNGAHRQSPCTIDTANPLPPGELPQVHIIAPRHDDPLAHTVAPEMWQS